jgi:hypothetical protein
LMETKTVIAAVMAMFAHLLENIHENEGPRFRGHVLCFMTGPGRSMERYMNKTSAQPAGPSGRCGLAGSHFYNTYMQGNPIHIASQFPERPNTTHARFTPAHQSDSQSRNSGTK